MNEQIDQFVEFLKQSPFVSSVLIIMILLIMLVALKDQLENWRSKKW